MQTTSSDDDHDLDQLFELARAFAEEGDDEARAAMYDRFATKAADPSLYRVALDLGGDQIIRLDGVAGFLFVAEHLGARKLANDDLWADDYWLQLAEERSGAETVQRKVERARGQSPAVNSYMEAVEATRIEQNPGSHRRIDWGLLSYDELKPLIGQGGRTMPIMGLSRWGQSAGENALHLAATDLLEESNPRRLLDYVRIFGKRAFPLDPQPLIRLAWGNDEKLSWAAGLALGHVRHSLVRETALRFLVDPTKIDQSVGLLIPNYEPGDHALIEQALTAPQNTEEEIVGYHHMGGDALNFFETNLGPEFAASLLTLYERGPCSNCRERCFDQLQALGQLPAWIVEECRYDANPDLRKKASSSSAAETNSN